MSSDVIFFIVVAVISVVIALIQYRNSRDIFRSLIESELSVYGLTLIDAQKPKFTDKIPDFNTKLSLENFITNGGSTINEYTFRKICISDLKGHMHIVWVEIKKNKHHEYVLRFRPALEDCK